MRKKNIKSFIGGLSMHFEHKYLLLEQNDLLSELFEK